MEIKKNHLYLCLETVENESFNTFFRQLWFESGRIYLAVEDNLLVTELDDWQDTKCYIPSSAECFMDIGVLKEGMTVRDIINANFKNN